VEALNSEYPGHVTWPASNWTEYGLPVGDEPSDVWYCGSWTHGVKLRFESGRLVSTLVERRSLTACSCLDIPSCHLARPSISDARSSLNFEKEI
jgi:hypothetical protein